jgi:hypothetical protein
VLVCLVLREQFDLDLCNDCNKLWSDDHNYVKFIIKIDSLVKFGLSIFFTIFILSLLLSFFHD